MLWHGDDLAPDLLPGKGSNVHPIHTDRAALHINKTEEAHDEGSLAAAGPAANSNLLTGFDGEGNLLEN
jgi:hypothetical protein